MKVLGIVTTPYDTDRNPIFSVGKDLYDLGLKHSSSGFNLKIDWGYCDFSSVSQIAAIAMVIKHYKRTSSINMVSPTNSSVDGYLKRMDFYKQAGINTDENFIRHESYEKFMPLTSVQTDCIVDNVTSELVAVLKKNLSVDRSVPDTFNLVFGEIIDNISLHAKAMCGGIATAQWYPNKGYVELCVVDNGIGIPETIKDNISLSGCSDQELLQKAFEQSVGRDSYIPDASKRRGQGMGLSLTSNLVKALSGNLWAISHNAALSISKSGFKKLSGLYFPGTIISMRLPIQSSTVVTSNDIYHDGVDAPTRWTPQDGRFTSEEDHLLW